MSDIRKRTGKNGDTYQVRYRDLSKKSGYSYKAFPTRKQALAFRDDAAARKSVSYISSAIRTVPQAIDKWLEVCELEGRKGRDPVTGYTLKNYRYRAEIMKSYGWKLSLHQLTPPDIIEFRSWLLQKCVSRDQARKVLSSFHSVISEMALRGIMQSNIASEITIRAKSRYDEPVTIPSLPEVQAILSAADRLANSKNLQIAKSWERYRPLLYLAADSGMRPQEYLVVSGQGHRECGNEVSRAIERPGTKLSVTKTYAGRRFIDLSPDVFDMVAHYRDHLAVDNKHDLIFPTSTGHWQSIDNWRNRGFKAACMEAGLAEEKRENGKTIIKSKYTPYALRHFYASVLIDSRINLKRIQKLMGHQNIETTLNTYGHLIERSEAAQDKATGILSKIS